MPPPGAPVFLLMLTPANFPLRAPSKVWVGAFTNSSPETVATEFARFFRLTEDANPETTISSVFNTSFINEIFRVSLALIFNSLYPI